MTTEYQEAFKAFKERAKRVKEVVGADFRRELEADTNDAKDEAIAELLVKDKQGAPTPTEEICAAEAVCGLEPCIPQNEWVTKRKDGSVLSVFGEDCWIAFDKRDNEVFVYFGQNTKDHLDFNDPTAKAFRTFQKLHALSIWPKKNPALKPYAPNTLLNHVWKFTDLLDWLYRKGFLRNHDPEIPPNDVELITPSILRQEMDRRIDAKAHYSELRAFAGAIRQWCVLGKKPYCPEWLRPGFKYEEVVTRPLARRIGKLHAETQERWRAIDFDDLESMLMTAKHYIDVYSNDLFWIEDRLAEAYELAKDVSKNDRIPPISDNGMTVGIFEALNGYRFANVPKTFEPWFELKKVDKNADIKNRSPVWTINRKPIYDEADTLVGAALFILLIFTGMRHDEARHLTVNSLRIDGKPIDFSRDPVEQVESAGVNAFDLVRAITKTVPYLQAHETPVPKIAAKAFAILCKILRHGRAMIGTDFLFPRDGITRPGGKPLPGKFDNILSLHRYLMLFCEAAGVEYQHPHRCRKSLATLIINHDSSSLKVIQFLLGHNTMTMTLEYIMALPGINEELINHFYEAQSDKIIEWLTDALEGHVAGPMGEHIRETILEDLEQPENTSKRWTGTMLPWTIKSVIKSMMEGSISIHRIPATWCMWFDIRVPRDAPCLMLMTRDAIAEKEPIEPKDYFPNPEFCVPYECGYAGHSRSDLPLVKRNLRHAEKMASGGTRAARAHYERVVEYWNKVADILEYGDPRFKGLYLLDDLICGALP